ncbi:DUF2974 domain-containing protein [Leptospira idonii]|uniref:DUF2974 domain-containing protein n=2 Tax=Leptospira idonii TaxID=1193500 RepID=A0A4R9LV05_9LEPT|nr:DUF2974 domain-containing protein [Leptospira idonii]
MGMFGLIQTGIHGVKGLIRKFDTIEDIKALRQDAERMNLLLSDPEMVSLAKEKYGELEFSKKIEAYKQNLMSEATYLDFESNDPEMVAMVKEMTAALAILGVERVTREQLIERGADPAKFENKDSGLHSDLFFDKNTEKYVLAFRGTDSFLDAWIDIKNIVGVVTDQHQQAMDLAQSLDRLPEFKNKLTFTGHSLGGGLASAAAGITGSTAFTFNSANLNDATRTAMGDNANGLENRVNYYYLPGELASLGQDSFNLSAEGNRTALDGQLGRPWLVQRGFINLHSNQLMTNVLYNDILNGRPRAVVITNPEYDKPSESNREE